MHEVGLPVSLPVQISQQGEHSPQLLDGVFGDVERFLDPQSLVGVEDLGEVEAHGELDIRLDVDIRGDQVLGDLF